MGRPELPLDPAGGPLAAFADDLRALRHKAGTPSYRQLAARAHFSATALSRAASGQALPSLEVTLAFVAACDGDTRAWQARWRAVRTELTAATGVDAESDSELEPGRDPGISTLTGGVRVRGRLRVAVAFAVALAVAGGVGAVLRPSLVAGHASTTRPAPAGAAATRQTHEGDDAGPVRPVLREGSVTLRPDQLIDFDNPSWPMSSGDDGNPYDLQLTSDQYTLTSIGADDITILPPSRHGTRDECAARNDYSQPVTAPKDHVGTQFCLITDARRYVLCRITGVQHDAAGHPSLVRLHAVLPSSLGRTGQS
ncbi:helix-turn-helix domain-containing protein [Streptomyces sp. NPDC101152]|uniref:helix-turn-helix domain-containing protein n=1 Tax=Streptomyces sp. NPDC101152 TaxID=3366116 RepID=UPI00381CFDCF